MARGVQALVRKSRITEPVDRWTGGVLKISKYLFKIPLVIIGKAQNNTAH